MDWFKSIQRKGKKALALSRSDRQALIQAWFCLLITDLALRLLPFAKVQELVTKHNDYKPTLCNEASIAGTIERLSQLVGIAAHNHLYPMLCLRRSMVLQFLLRNRGIVTSLRFGVRMEKNELSAHAWLEYGGLPVAEAETILDQFAPLGSLRREMIIA